MPRKAEYERIRARGADSYPARFHEALFRLMGGQETVVIGTSNYGAVEVQRVLWRHFLRSFGADTPMGQWISGHQLRSQRTREPSGCVALWVSARPVARGDMFRAIKKV